MAETTKMMKSVQGGEERIRRKGMKKKTERIKKNQRRKG